MYMNMKMCFATFRKVTLLSYLSISRKDFKPWRWKDVARIKLDSLTWKIWTCTSHPSSDIIGCWKGGFPPRRTSHGNEIWRRDCTGHWVVPLSVPTRRKPMIYGVPPSHQIFVMCGTALDLRLDSKPSSARLTYGNRSLIRIIITCPQGYVECTTSQGLMVKPVTVKFPPTAWWPE
jgi:hypothetical protein